MSFMPQGPHASTLREPCYLAPMQKGRLEAFSDGVIAVAITIMVLDLRPPPHTQDVSALRDVLPAFFGYVLSFLYIGIYWNNHHHLLHAVKHVTGMTLWANLHLLFWITLIPFVTGWVGESNFGAWPAATYGFVLLMAAGAWQILARVLVRHHGPGSAISLAIGRGRKEWISTGLFVVGIATALTGRWLGWERWAGAASFLAYAAVAAIWFVPDKRLEHAIRAAE
jgi:uncharacterized membrane protein